MKNLKLIVFIIVSMTLLSVTAFASIDCSISGDIYEDFVGSISGAVGTTIGLVVSLIGTGIWLLKGQMFGIVIALGGALTTAYPGFYKSFASGSRVAFENVIGEAVCKSSSSSTGGGSTAIGGGGSVYYYVP